MGQINDGGRSGDSAIQHMIQQVLETAGEIANHGRAHRPTAAFEGMESAANHGQSLAVRRIPPPAGQMLLDRRQLACRFLQEHLNDIDFQRRLCNRRFRLGALQQRPRLFNQHRQGRQFASL